MPDVRVSEELWATAILPEGILEQWLVEDGTLVRAGQAVAAVRIGEALHEIVSPTSGRLDVVAQAREVVDPGCVIAEVHA
ncbi:biotin/lipoyl-containing protein [Methylobacterium sp. NEAU K]|uniref:biotin/lipoyl-containing protein n=1 Tax=Methylobacterium sp. NEAU K TaxID=3064946 RepID=UPI0027325FA4|nr:biotin/lipoyl-containing protein [Methylobacterium sp. NEAU K]MDP4003353.1 biotin/lipoyl-containing protein [Methylobacterium sp. NEAU K]